MVKSIKKKKGVQWNTWIHCQGHAELLTNKLLSGILAEVDTESDALALFQIPAWITVSKKLTFISLLRKI